MSSSATAYTLDSILEHLDSFHQRATYGAVAAVVGTSARSLMAGRERNSGSSWIVSSQTGQPTGYAPEQVHESLTERDVILRNPEALLKWLEDPG
jgi:hypothetical protein